MPSQTWRTEDAFLYRGRSQISYVMPFSLFGYVLSIILLITYLTKVFNGYILLTTNLPQWHDVICEWPLCDTVDVCNFVTNQFNPTF